MFTLYGTCSGMARRIKLDVVLKTALVTMSESDLKGCRGCDEP